MPAYGLAHRLHLHHASPTDRIEYAEQFSSQFLVDLMRNRPVLIVDLDQSQVLSLDRQKRATQLLANRQLPDLPVNINQVFEYINANYHVETVFRNATVYRLNGTSRP